MPTGELGELPSLHCTTGEVTVEVGGGSRQDVLGWLDGSEVDLGAELERLGTERAPSEAAGEPHSKRKAPR
jgi:hypothetical protein